MQVEEVVWSRVALVGTNVTLNSVPNFTQMRTGVHLYSKPPMFSNRPFERWYSCTEHFGIVVLAKEAINLISHRSTSRLTGNSHAGITNMSIST